MNVPTLRALAGLLLATLVAPGSALAQGGSPVGVPLRIWAEGVSEEPDYFQDPELYLSTDPNRSDYRWGTFAEPGEPIQYLYEKSYDQTVNAKIRLTGQFLPSLPSDPIQHDGMIANGYTTTSAYSNMRVDLGLVRVLPGASYQLTVSRQDVDDGVINVTAPSGYRVILNGMARNSCELQTVTIQVIPPADTLPGVAGYASSVAALPIAWKMALGSLASGESAGWLGLLDTGADVDWDRLYNPGALSYETTSDEVYVYRQSNVIRQIIANQVAVDVVTLGGTAYEIRCYNPIQIQSNVPCTFSGEPFAVYRIEQGTTVTSLKFTKEIRNIPDPFATNVPVTRREIMTLERTGTDWLNFQWVKTDWTLENQATIAQTVFQNGGTVAARTQEVSIQAPGGATALRVSRLFDGDNAFGEVPMSETLGNDPNLTTSFDFYTDQAEPGSFGFVESVEMPGGGWERLEYYESDELYSYFSGRVKNRYRVHGDLPQGNWEDAEHTYYEYAADPWGFMNRPSLVRTTIDGVTVAESTRSYSVLYDSGSYQIMEAVERNYASGTGYSETVTHFFAANHSDALLRGKPILVKTADGTETIYHYEHGSWNGSEFDPGNNWALASRISTITGSSDSSAGTLASTYSYPFQSPDRNAIYLVDGKSTKSVIIRDERALVVRTESHLWTGSDWELITFVDHHYNFAGQLTRRTSHNGVELSQTWDGLLKRDQTDATGATTRYLYDAGGRVAYTISQGTGDISSVTTRFIYDAVGRVLEKRIGWDLPVADQLITTSHFDDAGQLMAYTEPGKGTVTYFYEPADNRKTTTYPDGGDVTETSYFDGRPKSVEGTATVAQYYSYGVDSATGNQWTQVNIGEPDSFRWTRAWRDWLGRDVKSERPGFAGAADYVEEMFYDDTSTNSSRGKLIKSTAPTRAPRVFEYGPLGELFRSGLDFNDNGVLEPNSTERINESDTFFQLEGTDWWSVTEERAYADNAVLPFVTSRTRTRLTGHAPGIVAETQSTDAEGNVTTQTTAIDRLAATTTVSTTTSGIAGIQTALSVLGLPVSSTSFDGLTTTTGYDSLRRPITFTDSRGNTTTTTYVPGSILTHYVTDATGVDVATQTYDQLGRVIASHNAHGHATYSSYNVRGQVERMWGPATYPVEYGYDGTYGDRLTMTSYRAGTGWDGIDWPTATTGPGDTTAWTHDPATGWLAAKTDAAGQAVIYDYCSCGKISSRTWARGVTTNYVFDPLTNEQIQVNYSDGTPSVTTTYDRLGNVKTVDDNVTGTRTFTYDPAKPWRLVSETLDDYYGNRQLIPHYETTGVIGRARGFELDHAGTRELDRTYSYQPNGRFDTLTATRDHGAITRDFHYGYEPGSALLKSLSVDNGHPFTITREFEAQRNLVTSIDAKWSTTSQTRYAYGYNDLRQRDHALQSGAVFDDYHDTIDTIRREFTYDSRGQLTGDEAYLGPTVNPAQKLLGRQYTFGYDSFGNRSDSNHTVLSGVADAYATNSLNQYVTRENNTLPVSGTAATTAGVAVMGMGGTNVAERMGRYWHDSLNPANVTGPWEGPVTVYTGEAGAGPGGAELVRTDVRLARIAQELQTFTYDEDGNMLTDGVWDYTWDAENRLVRMETTTGAIAAGLPHQILAYAYDHLHRRVSKHLLDGASNHLLSGQRYLYQGWNLLTEYTEAETTAPGNIIRSYTWGLDIVSSLTDAGGVGALVQITDHASGRDYLPTYDGNGNILALIDAEDTGGPVIAAAYEYDPYGNLLRSSGTYAKANPIRFSTKYTDDETGLVYYGRRYYDPHNGRFLGRDPISEAGGLNLYAFVLNNPINAWDYLGMNPNIGRAGVDMDLESFRSFSNRLQYNAGRSSFRDPRPQSSGTWWTGTRGSASAVPRKNSQNNPWNKSDTITLHIREEDGSITTVAGVRPDTSVATLQSARGSLLGSIDTGAFSGPTVGVGFTQNSVDPFQGTATVTIGEFQSTLIGAAEQFSEIFGGTAGMPFLSNEAIAHAFNNASSGGIHPFTAITNSFGDIANALNTGVFIAPTFAAAGVASPFIAEGLIGLSLAIDSVIPASITFTRAPGLLSMEQIAAANTQIAANTIRVIVLAAASPTGQTVIRNTPEFLQGLVETGPSVPQSASEAWGWVVSNAEQAAGGYVLIYDELGNLVSPDGSD